MKYRIGDGAGGRTHNDRQVGDHFWKSSTIYGEQLPRSRTFVFENVKRVTPTPTTLKRRGCEWLGIGKVTNVFPRSERELKRMDRRSSASVDRHSERRNSKRTKHKLTLEIKEYSMK